MTEEKIQQADVHLAAPGCLSALRAATVGQPLWGWQPIETAPKDGTEVLAWRDDCGVFMAKYTCADALSSMTDKERDELDEESLFQEDWFGGDSDSNWRLEGSEVPTHWMPLPGAPTGQSRTFEAGEATCASNEPDEQNQAEFELHCDGEFAAGASGPRERAWAEIQHYAAQYAQDGPVEIYEVKRTLVASQPTGERNG